MEVSLARNMGGQDNVLACVRQRALGGFRC